MPHQATSTPAPHMATPEHALTPDPLPVPDGVPTAPTARALWAALLAHPDATAADLARTAAIGRSTASKILAVLAEAGLATRVQGSWQGHTRLPDHWHATSPASTDGATPVRDLPPVGEGPSTGPDGQALLGDGAGASGSITPQAVGEALQRGQLRDLVATYLRSHPDQELTPTAIARGLDRSAGAVANACASLTARGLATRTNAHPRRYRATSLLRNMP